MALSSTTPSDGSDGPIYFWRETEHPWGVLSQWYTIPFTAPSHPKSESKTKQGAATTTFVTTEQYMMYHKAMVFDDVEIAERIMLEPDPRKQKSLGRKVKKFDNKIWNEHREKVVEEGNWWKFTAAKGGESLMRKRLLDTGDRLLVEVRDH